MSSINPSSSGTYRPLKRTFYDDDRRDSKKNTSDVKAREVAWKILDRIPNLHRKAVHIHLKEAEKKHDFPLVKALIEVAQDMRVKFNTGDFNLYLDCAVKTRNLKEIDAIYESMQDEGLEATLTTHTIRLNGYCKAGKIVEACELKKRIEKRGFPLNLHTYNPLIREYCETGKLKEAINLVNEMESKEIYPDYWTYTNLVKAKCKAKDLKGALEFLYTAEKKQVELRTLIYNVIINQYCEEGKVDEAYQFLKRMEKRGIAPDVNSYSPIIRGRFEADKHFESDKYKKTLALVKEMEDEKKILPDGDVYTTLVNIKCDEGDMDGAMTLLETAERRKVKLKSPIYNTIIKAYCKRKETEKGYQLFLKMKDTMRNGRTYTTLICGYSNEKKMDEADKLVPKMRENNIEPDAFTYTPLIHGHCLMKNKENTKKAVRLFDEAIDLRIDLHIHVYNALFNTCCREEDLKTSRRIFDMIPMKDKDIKTYTALIQLYCKSKNLLEALLIFNIAKNDKRIKLDDIIYTTIINGCSIARQMKTASTVLTEMIQNKIEPTAATYNNLIGGYFQDENVLAVEKCLKEMDAKKIKWTIVTYNILIAGYLHLKNVIAAEHYYNKMQKEDNIKPNNVTYVNLIVGYHNNGLLTKTPEVFDAMVKQEMYLSQSLIDKYNNNIDRYNAFVYEFNKIQKLYQIQKKDNEAYQLLQLIMEHGMGPHEVTSASLLDCVNILIAAHCKEARFNEAERLYNMLIKYGIPPNQNTHDIFCQGYYAWQKEKEPEYVDVFQLAYYEGVFSIDYETRGNDIKPLQGNLIEFSINSGGRL